MQTSYQAEPDKAWETEGHDPFKLTTKPDGRMVGRGSTDDKGPILGWINVLEAHRGLSLPVNLRFCFEGMEESGSIGLNDYLDKADAKEYFAGVTDVCIVSNPTCTLLHGH
jgi:Cys-Gly metallodipeptidase DUG1